MKTSIRFFAVLCLMALVMLPTAQAAPSKLKGAQSSRNLQDKKPKARNGPAHRECKHSTKSCKFQ